MILSYGWSNEKFVMMVTSDSDEPHLKKGTVLHRISLAPNQLEAITNDAPLMENHDSHVISMAHQQMI